MESSPTSPEWRPASTTGWHGRPVLNLTRISLTYIRIGFPRPDLINNYFITGQTIELTNTQTYWRTV